MPNPNYNPEDEEIRVPDYALEGLGAMQASRRRVMELMRRLDKPPTLREIILTTIGGVFGYNPR